MLDLTWILDTSSSTIVSQALQYSYIAIFLKFYPTPYTTELPYTTTSYIRIIKSCKQQNKSFPDYDIICACICAHGVCMCVQIGGWVDGHEWICVLCVYVCKST